jgi:hypothetical protein
VGDAFVEAGWVEVMNCMFCENIKPWDDESGSGGWELLLLEYSFLADDYKDDRSLDDDGSKGFSSL